MDQRRARAARRARALVAVGAVGLLAACGAPATGGSGSQAVVAPEADCLAPEVLGELGLTLDPGLAARASHTPAPTAGRVPDDFVPTAVLQCQVGGQMRDGAGTWTAVTATSREGSTAAVATLVSAIDRGASAAAKADDSSCSADDRPVVLWLLDALGRAVRPSLTLDGCGAPTADVRTALDGLAVTDVVDRPVELVTPAP